MSASVATVVCVTDFHVYDPFEVPMVEVEQDGTWWPGQARMRTTHRDGRVTYQVQYLRDGSNFLDVFPAERVRLDTVDRSYGRG